MPKIHFVTHDGNVIEVDAKAESSLMQAAVDNGIDAILGECGGVCSCATCHCYIDEAWSECVPAAEAMEQDMLDCVSHPQANSRLSCQIRITDAMEGMVVHLPESQY